MGGLIHDRTQAKNRSHVDGSDDRWVQPTGHWGLSRDILELRRIVVERRKQLHVLKRARKFVSVLSRSYASPVQLGTLFVSGRPSLTSLESIATHAKGRGAPVSSFCNRQTGADFGSPLQTSHKPCLTLAAVFRCQTGMCTYCTWSALRLTSLNTVIDAPNQIWKSFGCHTSRFGNCRNSANLKPQVKSRPKQRTVGHS